MCGGKRYNEETLDIRYKGKNIYEVLEMTVEEALDFFEHIPKIHKKLKTLRITNRRLRLLRRRRAYFARVERCGIYGASGLRENHLYFA